MHIKKKVQSMDGILRPEKVTKEVKENSEEIIIEVPKASHYTPKSSGVKSVFFSGMKIVGVSVLAIAILSGVSSVGSTVSYFDSKALAKDKPQLAGLLRVSLTKQPISTSTPNDVGFRTFGLNVKASDSTSEILYTAKGELDPLNPAGCELMAIDAVHGDYHFNGFMDELIASTTSSSSDIAGEWQFMIGLPTFKTSLPPNAACKGSIVFSARLAGTLEELSYSLSDDKKYTFDIYNWDTVFPETEASQSISHEVVTETPVPTPVTETVVVPPAATTTDESLGTTTPETASTTETIIPESNTENTPESTEATSTPETTASSTEASI